MEEEKTIAKVDVALATCHRGHMHKGYIFISDCSGKSQE